MKTKSFFLLAAVMILMSTSCRRTKTCVCEGILYGKPEVVYINVEHNFRCKDVSRMGYETQQDSVFIRSMHNMTCTKFEEDE